MAFSRKALYALVGVAVFATCVLWSLHVWLPVFLNSETFRRLTPVRGIGPLAWQVRRVGLTGLDIDAVSVGAGASPALSVASIQADYDPGSLIKGRLRRMSIIGLSVHCGVREGRFFLKGLDPERFQKAPASESAPARPPAIPFDRLEVLNSLIVFDWEGTPFRIPFSLRLITDPDRPETLEGMLTATPFNQPVTLQTDLDLKTLSADISLLTKAFRIGALRELLPPAAHVSMDGKLYVAATGRVALSPMAVEDIRAAVELKDYAFRLGALALSPRDGNGAGIGLRVDQTAAGAWGIRVSDVAIQGPVPVFVPETTVAVALNGKTVTLSGESNLRMSADIGVGDIALKHPLSMNIPFSGTLAPDRSGVFSLSGGFETDEIRLAKGNIVVSTRSPRFGMDGRFAPENVSADLRVRLARTEISAPGMTATIPEITVSGNMAPAHPQAVALAVAARDTVCETGDMTARLPSATLEGRLSLENGLSWDGRFKLSDGTAGHGGVKAGMSGLSAELPFAWPWRSDTAGGRFSVKRITRDGKAMGAISGRITPTPEGVAYSGKVNAAPLSGFGIDWKGEAAFLRPDMPIDVSFSAKYRPKSPLALTQLVPAADGITLEGELSLNGRWQRIGNRMTGTATLALKDGTVTAADRNLTVEGLGVQLEIPELMQLESAPAQRMSAASVRLGALNFKDLEMRFQVEPGGSVLLEKGGFKWCGGNVNLRSLRILPGVADYDLILYCDRVNLAELLRQLGAAKADGEGAVNGRIPVRLKDGVFRFDDGFLYSTPGDGGTIHVTAAEMLTAGIPENSPQFAQIDLAREALKSYDYKWVRLRLFSEGENLMLRLQFDGKPTRPLPFVYKKEFGGFARVETDHPGSNFQGIRLDVNLGLPLDRILRYKGLLDMIQ